MTNSKFTRLYGKGVRELSKELKVSAPALCSWVQKGFDIFVKAEQLNGVRGNRRLQRLWGNMLSRCGNPLDKKYKFYGGKGIKVEMNKVDLVRLWKRDGANKMKVPSIDRIDSNKNYTFDNCRFIEMKKNLERRWKK